VGHYFAHIVSPRGGTFAILLRPGSWAFDTPIFESTMDEFSGKDAAFVEQWLVRQGLKNLSTFLKVCSLNFGYLFIHLKYLMLKKYII